MHLQIDIAADGVAENSKSNETFRLEHTVGAWMGDMATHQLEVLVRRHRAPALRSLDLSFKDDLDASRLQGHFPELELLSLYGWAEGAVEGSEPANLDAIRNQLRGLPR